MELFPSHQAKKFHDNDYKHEKVSWAINLWNSLLRKNTALFQQAHPDAKVTYVEIWDLFYQAFLHPESLGAPNSTCIDPNGKDCVSHPHEELSSCTDQFKLWANPGHPGEKIHQLIGARIAEKAWGSAVI
jgi:phospholipase/lecithinase/hemolysin